MNCHNLQRAAFDLGWSSLESSCMAAKVFSSCVLEMLVNEESEKSLHLLITQVASCSLFYKTEIKNPKPIAMKRNYGISGKR